MLEKVYQKKYVRKRLLEKKLEKVQMPKTPYRVILVDTKKLENF